MPCLPFEPWLARKGLSASPCERGGIIEKADCSGPWTIVADVLPPGEFHTQRGNPEAADSRASCQRCRHSVGHGRRARCRAGARCADREDPRRERPRGHERGDFLPCSYLGPSVRDARRIHPQRLSVTSRLGPIQPPAWEEPGRCSVPSAARGMLRRWTGRPSPYRDQPRWLRCPWPGRLHRP